VSDLGFIPSHHRSMQVPIFLINLDESPDRLQHVASRLERLGLSYERVPAISGKALTSADKKTVYPERPWILLSDTELACHMSHLKAIRLVAERELWRAIILEDDATFDDDLVSWTDRKFPLPPDLDILKLEGFDKVKTIKVPILEHCGKAIRFSYKPTWGAAAYLITLAGAKKTLKELAIVKGQLDYDLFAYWKTGLAVYEAFPFPVRQDGSPGTIHHHHVRPPVLHHVLRYFIRRFDRIRRLYFTIRKFGMRALLNRPQ
jgi:glycosyl transferase family 25